MTIDPEDSGNDNMSAYLMPPVPYPDGRWYMRVGPAMQPVVQELRTAQDVRIWYAEERITPEQARFLRRMMRLLVPGLQPATVREARCVVDKTPSRYPTGRSQPAAQAVEEAGRIVTVDAVPRTVHREHLPATAA